MARRPLRISVSGKDRKPIDELLSSTMQPVRVVLRALALLHPAEGATAPATALSLKKLTSKAVRSIAHRYLEGGLERALYEKARPGAAPLLTPSEKQRIVAMVCSDPPEGQARWTVRLIADEAVKRKLNMVVTLPWTAPRLLETAGVGSQHSDRPPVVAQRLPILPE